MEEEVLNTFFT